MGWRRPLGSLIAGGSGPEAGPAAQVLEGRRRLESGASFGGAGRSQSPPPGGATRRLPHSPGPAPPLRRSAQSPSGLRVAPLTCADCRRGSLPGSPGSRWALGLGACGPERARRCDFPVRVAPTDPEFGKIPPLVPRPGTLHLLPPGWRSPAPSWNSSPCLHARP